MSESPAPVPALSEKELCPENLLAGQEAAFARDIARLQARRDEFVEVACPACGRPGAPRVFEKFGFVYRKCADCHTLYMSPRPSEEVMAGYYADSENYRYWAEHIFPASEESRREKIHRPWLDTILGYCETWGIERTAMIEVGPGFGTFGALAREAFESYTAVEPTPELAAACRARGLDVIDKRVEDVTPGALVADVVVSFEVIEHLFAPERFLRACREMIRPKGLLILSCPNGLGFDIESLGPRSLAVDAEHVNLFNPESLSGLVARLGFEVLDVRTPGRLDAELVRNAALRGEIDLAPCPFLRRVLLDEWDRRGAAFQKFLVDQNLSSHMWLVARPREMQPADHEKREMESPNG